MYFAKQEECAPKLCLVRLYYLFHTKIEEIFPAANEMKFAKTEYNNQSNRITNSAIITVLTLKNIFCRSYMDHLK